MRATVEVHLGPEDLAEALRRDVAAALTAHPRELAPKWFYDDRGSALFEEITRQPWYYLTQAEAGLLAENASFVAGFTGADTFIELGSGTSEKTVLLMEAFEERRQLRRFVPFDVSEATLRQAASSLASRYPTVEVTAVVGDFDHHLGCLPDDGRRLVALLGSTIGNFDPKARAHFLSQISAILAPGDALLLGTDLVKDPVRLVAAYDDPDGITAEFNRNVLRVINRELGADFAPRAYDHVARWDEEAEWMEMLLRSDRDQQVRVAELDLAADFSLGEEMRTEISTKFRREPLADELAAAGLALGRWWTDGDFALSLSFKE